MKTMRRFGFGLAIALVLIDGLAAWLAVRPVITPPAPLPASASKDVFSAERAMEHLRVIARQPHPVGSPALAQARDYIAQEIRSLGYEPVVEEKTGAIPVSRGMMSANVNNILVRIPAASGNPSPGVLGVMAHYDSQPNTPAASDDGIGVASILETMRALQAGPGLKNDLIVVLTDCEEMDAQGSDAFYSQHPWAKEIQAMINLESGSPDGASFLTQTTRGNLHLSQGFVQAVPHPVAYSFLTQLLSVMPGGFGTDMSVFAENGVPGLEPMFGLRYRIVYHSSLDNVDSVDMGTLQHQGEYTLGLVRYFGNLDLSTLKTNQDAVFFTLFPDVNIWYPAGWAVPFAILAGFSLISLMVAGMIRRKLTLGGMLAGVGIALVRVLVPVLLAGIVWYSVASAHPQYWRNLMGSPYQSDVYMLGFIALTMTASLALFALTRSKVSAVHQTIGALLIWLIPALLTSMYLPGMSYLFTWPLLAVTLLVGFGLLGRDRSVSSSAGSSWASLAGLAISGIVTVAAVAPVIVLLYILLGFWFITFNPALPIVAVAMLFVALTLVLLTPHMEVWMSGKKWIAPGIAAFLAVSLIAYASIKSSFTPGQPMQNGVWYEMNGDTGAAAWYTLGDKPEDPWTQQFFPGATQPVQLGEIYPALSPLAELGGFQGQAPAADLPGPELTVLSDETHNGVRTLRLHLSSQRQARGLRVEVAGSPVLAAAVNGVRETDAGWVEQNLWLLRFYGLDDRGIELTLEVTPSHPLKIVLADQSEGLPKLEGVSYTSRGPDMVEFAMAQEMMPYAGTTSVTKTYELQ